MRSGDLRPPTESGGRFIGASNSLSVQNRGRVSSLCLRRCRVLTPACQPPLTWGKVPLFWHRRPLSALTPPQALRPCRRSSFKKIANKEYVDMCELLPETWRLDSEAQGSCCQTKWPRRGMITDFQVWSECYTTMGGILSARYPDKASHLFTYLRTISRQAVPLRARLGHPMTWHFADRQPTVVP